eukprot:1165888-Amphidinium_carterae.1
MSQLPAAQLQTPRVHSHPEEASLDQLRGGTAGAVKQEKDEVKEFFIQMSSRLGEMVKDLLELQKMINTRLHGVSFP